MDNLKQDFQPHAEHGVAIDHRIPQDDVVQAQPDLLWSRIRHQLREPFAEFFGTFILIMFGDGVVAQVVLSNGENGDYQSITWGWGLGVMLGVYTGGISGAHLNPAVTFANCLFRKFPWRKFPIYMLAQVLGAMVASAVVYANYKSAIDVFEGGPNIRTVPGFSETATGKLHSRCLTSPILTNFLYSRHLLYLPCRVYDQNRSILLRIHCQRPTYVYDLCTQR